VNGQEQLLSPKQQLEIEERITPTESQPIQIVEQKKPEILPNLQQQKIQDSVEFKKLEEENIRLKIQLELANLQNDSNNLKIQK